MSLGGGGRKGIWKSGDEVLGIRGPGSWGLGAVVQTGCRAFLGFSRLGKRVLEEKGRLVNQKNHNELWGFPTGVPAHFFGLPLGLSVDCRLSFSAASCFQRSS